MRAHTPTQESPGSGGSESDAFVARLNPALTILSQATYLGGSGDDAANALAVTGSEVIVAGETGSTDFPATAGGSQAGLGGGYDAFIARLTSDLTAVPPPLDLPVDEYLCYQAKESKYPAQSKFKDLGVVVRTKDQFESQPYRQWGLTKFVSFCNPVLPTPAGGNSAIHLTEFAIKDTKAVAKFVPPASIYNLTDRLQVASVTIGKPKSLLVRTSKNDWGPITKCKVDADCAGTPLSPDCDEVAGICKPVSTAFPGNPGMPVNTADYVCYSVKGPKGPHGVSHIHDQFNYQVNGWFDKKITKICAPTGKLARQASRPSRTSPDT